MARLIKQKWSDDFARRSIFERRGLGRRLELRAVANHQKADA
jgi:hypothetical protein